MVRVAIAGAAGRMGRTLVEACSQSDDFVEVTVATVLADDPCIGVDSGLLSMGTSNGVITVADLSCYSDDFDVLIDFTEPGATMEHLNACRALQKAIVIGTTGLNDEQRRMVRNVAAHIPLVFAPNMSIGVNLCFNLLEKAAKVLGSDFDVEISEAHHRFKKDAPSGTALEMGKLAAQALDRNLDDVAVYGREGIGSERDPSTIGFSTMRAGDIVGDHTVTFAGQGERVEITHKASSRMTFAKGAVRAANWVVSKPAGIYSMQEVLGLNDLSKNLL